MYKIFDNSNGAWFIFDNSFDNSYVWERGETTIFEICDTDKYENSLTIEIMSATEHQRRYRSKLIKFYIDQSIINNVLWYIVNFDALNLTLYQNYSLKL